jgi:nicotinamidase/pyrazinamidase
MTAEAIRPRAGDALILVDVQLDFLPGGSLAVPRGDEVVPALNRYIAVFRGLTFPVVATRDWHPPDHCSFKARGGLWPPHCVAGSDGARFAPLLDLPCEARIVSKAMAPDKDAYSGFEGTDLDEWLKHAGASRLFVGGLATDYCVLNTVRDALRLGYATFLLLDAVRAVDVAPGDGARAIDEMRRLGAIPIEFGSLAA